MKGPVETNDISNEKEERTKIDPVLEHSAKKRKRGLISRLVTGVVGPEGLPGVGAYVSQEIILPAIQNIIVDAVTSGVNLVVYGDSKKGSRKGYGSPPPYSGGAHRPRVNYTSAYTSTQPEPTQRPMGRSPRQGVEEYIIEDRVGASNVLVSLTEHADRYGSVSVADYYDMIGVESVYTDNNYGWTLESISRSNIRPVRGGFVIVFAEPEVI